MKPERSTRPWRLRTSTLVAVLGISLLIAVTATPQIQRSWLHEFRIHYLSDMFLLVSNYGWIGLGHGRDVDVPSRDKSDLGINWTPSLEYPKLSKIGYLYYGNLAFGTIRGGDTLASTSFIMGGSFAEWHAFKDAMELSSIQASQHYHPTAHGEQQYYSEYSDTFVNPYSGNYLDYIEQRVHTPIGIAIHQSTVSSATSALRKAIIVESWAVNISDEPIDRGCIGFFFNADVFSDDYESEFGLLPERDDLIGIIRTVPSPAAGIADTVNLIWIADNDGDPYGASFGRASPRGVMGILPLRGPAGTRFQFNWWGTFGSLPNLPSWGPSKSSNLGKYVGVPGNRQSLGRPLGDRSAYFVMTNGEIDYSQTRSALDYSGDGWALPPNPVSYRNDLANGALVYGCISYGPLPRIEPGDSVPFAFALLVGEDFHRDPLHFSRTFDASDPAEFENGLDFSDLLSTARVTRIHFDNPGVDTDGDGYRGSFVVTDCDGSGLGSCDTVWLTGDGVPDWGSTNPPPPPIIQTETYPHSVKVTWSGAICELARDPLTNRRDFEGYRLYYSRTNVRSEYTLLASWDIPDNYYRLAYDEQEGRWDRISHPLRAGDWQALLGESFHPDAYDKPSLTNAYRDTIVDTVRDIDGQIVEVVDRERLSYWAREGPNHGNEYPDQGSMRPNLIRQIDLRDTVVEGLELQYGVYEAVVDNLNATVQLHFGVTSFDHGDYHEKIDPQETSPEANQRTVFPVYSADVVVDSALRVSVYPNPYKYSFPNAQGRTTTYFGQGYEGFGQIHLNEQDRRIWFGNLPDTATIRIYSLDGDLIREIHHPDQFLTRYSSVVGWDLVSRNTQAVVSGIYLWRVDSRLGSQIGKIVIIK